MVVQTIWMEYDIGGSFGFVFLYFLPFTRHRHYDTTTNIAEVIRTEALSPCEISCGVLFCMLKSTKY